MAAQERVLQHAHSQRVVDGLEPVEDDLLVLEDFQMVGGGPQVGLQNEDELEAAEDGPALRAEDPEESVAQLLVVQRPLFKPDIISPFFA